ncbi:MAG TPA: hypothetical protein VN207_00905 [Ktedonobacteraceae bacterium]|nr:hypothetical protein [Ktedonobacteraceae bacterium]
MSFDIVNTLEIPQGATELTTSQLKQISGGHNGQENSNKNQKGKNRKNRNKHNNQNRCEKRKNNHNCDDNNN